MSNVVVDIKHQRTVTAPDDGDGGHVQATDWNDKHLVDPSTFLPALRILLVTSDPNGTPNPDGPSGPRALAWDQTNSQLWINTDGGTTWTPFVRTDGGTAQGRGSFYLRGDSNGFGKGTETDMDDPADNVAIPNTNVVFSKIGGSANFSEPYTPTVLTTGALRILGFSPAHGPELTLGAELNALINGVGSAPGTSRKIWLDDVTISSTTLAQWMPGSSAGNASPLLGGGNLYTDSKNRALTQAAASGRQHACEFNTLGGNDAADSPDAAAVLTNIPAYIAQRRADLGSQLLFVWAIFQSTIPAGTFPFVSIARNNLINALSAIPGVALVYTEDVPVNASDLTHWLSISEQIVGARMAHAYRRLAGIQARIVSAPTVVGVSQATWNGTIAGLTGITGANTANLRAFPFQGSEDGDVMFMPCVTVNSGSGTTIPTPSGWSAAVTQLSSTDTATGVTHVAIFTKNLQQSELDGNNGFPLSPTVTPGGNTFMVKPFSVRCPPSVRFGPITASASFTHGGAIDTTPVSAPGISAVAGQTAFILVTCWNGGAGQSFTVTNGSIAGLTQVFGGVYPCASGAQVYLGLWTGTTTGNIASSTITQVLACNPCGFTWVM